jgi:hypothetical protein
MSGLVSGAGSGRDGARVRACRFAVQRCGRRQAGATILRRSPCGDHIRLQRLVRQHGTAFHFYAGKSDRLLGSCGKEWSSCYSCGTISGD